MSLPTGVIAPRAKEEQPLVPVDPRHYRSRRVKWIIYPFAAVAMLLGIVLAATPHHISPAIRVAAVAGVAACWWMARRAGRLGLEVDETGIVRLGAFQTQHITWDEIVGLSTARVFASVIVYLNLADGRRLQTGLVQGPTVVW